MSHYDYQNKSNKPSAINAIADLARATREKREQKKSSQLKNYIYDKILKYDWEGANKATVQDMLKKWSNDIINLVK